MIRSETLLDETSVVWHMADEHASQQRLVWLLLLSLMSADDVPTWVLDSRIDFEANYRLGNTLSYSIRHSPVLGVSLNSAELVAIIWFCFRLRVRANSLGKAPLYEPPQKYFFRGLVEQTDPRHH